MLLRENISRHKKAGKFKEDEKLLRKRSEAARRNVFLILLLAFSFFMVVGFRFFPFFKEKRKISIIKDREGHYQLLVEGEPFFIKGLCYNPIPIGENHTYDFWQQDLEIFKIDAELMHHMGANTIRIYGPGKDPKKTKEIINFLYEEFGIRTIMGHWLGFWQGSFPDYANLEFREKIKKDCLRMVSEFKDCKGILFWVLGNENNFSFGRQRLREWTSPELERIEGPLERRKAKARIYYKFVNEIARQIKKIDFIHPVALGNGGLDFIDIAKDNSRDLDLLGCSLYNGKSFSSAFRQVKMFWKKPFFFTEFGCDSFNAKTRQIDEEIQAKFITSQWKEIKGNSKGRSGEGNCLGGSVFEWTDEWWKTDEYDPSRWAIHDEKGTWSNGAYYFDIAAEGNLNMNEEWWGIVGLAPQDISDEGLPRTDIRIPKKSYYALKEFWKDK